MFVDTTPKKLLSFPVTYRVESFTNYKRNIVIHYKTSLWIYLKFWGNLSSRDFITPFYSYRIFPATKLLTSLKVRYITVNVLK